MFHPPFLEGFTVTRFQHQSDALHLELEPTPDNPPRCSGCQSVSNAVHEVGTGKAQPLDAKILTPTGWQPMGDIKVGDQVITQTGEPTTVEAIFPPGVKEIFRVVFSDGSSTE